MFGVRWWSTESGGIGYFWFAECSFIMWRCLLFVIILHDEYGYSGDKCRPTVYRVCTPRTDIMASYASAMILCIFRLIIFVNIKQKEPKLCLKAHSHLLSALLPQSSHSKLVPVAFKARRQAKQLSLVCSSAYILITWHTRWARIKAT